MSDSGDGGGDGPGGDGGSRAADECSEVGGGHSEAPDAAPLPSLEPVKIIHKEQDSIAAFCINKVSHSRV